MCSGARRLAPGPTGAGRCHTRPAQVYALLTSARLGGPIEDQRSPGKCARRGAANTGSPSRASRTTRLFFSGPRIGQGPFRADPYDRWGASVGRPAAADRAGGVQAQRPGVASFQTQGSFVPALFGRARDSQPRRSAAAAARGTLRRSPSAGVEELHPFRTRLHVPASEVFEGRRRNSSPAGSGTAACVCIRGQPGGEPAPGQHSEDHDCMIATAKHAVTPTSGPKTPSRTIERLLPAGGPRCVASALPPG
jgi:hypothetical protein